MLPIAPNTSLLPQFPKELQKVLLQLLKCDGMISKMLQVSKGDNEAVLMVWNRWSIDLNQGVPDGFSSRFSLSNPLPLSLIIVGANCPSFEALIDHMSVENRKISLMFHGNLNYPDINLLTKMTNLTNLNLVRCGLNYFDADGLSKLTSLALLSAPGNCLTDSFTKVIASTLVNLTSLNIAENSISEVGIRYLTSLRTLKKLHISENLLQTESKDLFKKILPGLIFKETEDDDFTHDSYNSRLSKWQATGPGSKAARDMAAAEIRAVLEGGEKRLVISGENCTTLPPIPPKITELVLADFIKLNNPLTLSEAKQLTSLTLINSVIPCLTELPYLRILTLDGAALCRPIHLALPELLSLTITGVPDVNPYVFLPTGLSGLTQLSVQLPHPALILPWDLFSLIENGKVIVSDFTLPNGLDKFLNLVQRENYAETMFKFGNGERSKTNPDYACLAFIYKEAAKAGHELALLESKIFAALDETNPDFVQANFEILIELINLTKRDVAQTQLLQTFYNVLTNLPPQHSNLSSFNTPEHKYILGKTCDALSDKKYALYYYEMAGEQGHSEAAFRAGMIHNPKKPWDPLGVFEDSEERRKAIKYFELAGPAHKKAQKELRELKARW